jgi:hypothetical protein
MSLRKAHVRIDPRTGKTVQVAAHAVTTHGGAGMASAVTGAAPSAAYFSLPMDDDDNDEEVCIRCSEPLNGGDGYDGRCGNCADGKEAHNEEQTQADAILDAAGVGCVLIDFDEDPGCDDCGTQDAVVRVDNEALCVDAVRERHGS